MEKYKVGYTTGVFDLFHIGHLNIIRQSKERCEILIVGVSTDDCVLEYKHKKPIISFSERIAIVEAIRYVDMAVPQKSMDKLSAWNELHYDALFHGDDWKNSSLYDRYTDELRSHGVDVVFLPHTTGTSSTQLAHKLQIIE